jgi:hypothetical protein
MDDFLKIFKDFVFWFISLFIHKNKITVSFNKEYGDSDDKIYISKKIYVQKEKHLKFKDESGRVVEFRSATGLHYIIEDL